MTKNLTVISTFATDRILNDKGKLIREQEGGPRFYISKALKKAKIDFNIISYPQITMEIVLKKNDEFGRVATKISPKRIDFGMISTPYLMISSLLNEYSLKELEKYKGKIFLDIQGFVRNGMDFGKKKFWNVPEKIANSIFCLKAADYEIEY